MPSMSIGIPTALNIISQPSGTGFAGPGVSSVTATPPIHSSGGTTPNISFPTWPADAEGFLHNDGAGVLSWSHDTGFVLLQATNPGITQVGNFHVSGFGQVGILKAGEFDGGTITGFVTAEFLKRTGSTQIVIYNEDPTVNDGSQINFVNDDSQTAWLKEYSSGGGPQPWNSGNGHLELHAGGPSFSLDTNNVISLTVDAEANIIVFGEKTAANDHSTSITIRAADAGDIVESNVSIEAHTPSGGGSTDFLLRLNPFVMDSPGAVRMQITDQGIIGNTGQFYFGNVAGVTAAIGGGPAADGSWIFVPDPGFRAIIDICDNPSDTGGSQLVLHAIDALGSGDGIHLMAVAVPGASERGSLAWDLAQRLFLPSTGAAGSNNTNVVITDAIGLGGTGVSDTSVAALTFTATDSNDNTSRASWEIQLPGDGVSPGDLIARTGAGIEWVRILGTTGQVVIDAPHVGPTLFHDTNFQGYLSVGGAAGSGGGIVIGNNGAPASASPSLIFKTTLAGPYIYGTDNGLNLFDMVLLNILDGSINPGGLGPNGNNLIFSSASGTSGIFQTSTTDGSNTNPTLIARLNTLQGATLFAGQNDFSETAVALDVVSGQHIAVSQASRLAFTYIDDGAGNFIKYGLDNGTISSAFNIGFIETGGAPAAVRDVIVQSFATGIGSNQILLSSSLSEMDFVLADGTQLFLTTGIFEPGTTNTIDLGSSSLKWKDGFFAGTVDAESFSGHSLSGISALFQTSDTTGANANATVVARANTGQLSNTLEVQDESSVGKILLTPKDNAGDGDPHVWIGALSSTDHLNVQSVNSILSSVKIESGVGDNSSEAQFHMARTDDSAHRTEVTFSWTPVFGDEAHSYLQIDSQTRWAGGTGGVFVNQHEAGGGVRIAFGVGTLGSEEFTVKSNGVVDAASYSVGGTPGVSFGPSPVVTLTVLNGLVTAHT